MFAPKVTAPHLDSTGTYRLSGRAAPERSGSILPFVAMGKHTGSAVKAVIRQNRKKVEDADGAVIRSIASCAGSKPYCRFLFRGLDCSHCEDASDIILIAK